MFKAGVFTSNAVCTSRDRELERAINQKLERGSVHLFTIKDEHAEHYGLTYSWRGLSKTFTRRTHELDVDDIAEGLAITARGMENVGLPHGWVYDEEDTHAFPDWVEDLNAP